MKKVFIGIDGGGTSTRVLICDEQLNQLGIGQSGPSSIDTVKPEKTEQSIREASEQAFKEANLAPSDVQVLSAVAGIGGIVSGDDKALVCQLLQQQNWCSAQTKVDAVNDMVIALAGGLSGRPGIVLIQGTGSVAYGVNSSGNNQKCGGWGWKEGDYASSYDLGINAIRFMLKAYDHRINSTQFCQAVYNKLKLTTINDITTLLYQKDITRTEIAGLAPLVTDWATKNDEIALKITNKAAKEATLLVQGVYNTLFKDQETEVVLVGSLANLEGPLKNRLVQNLQQQGIKATLKSPENPPIFGAAVLAKQEVK